MMKIKITGQNKEEMYSLLHILKSSLSYYGIKTKVNADLSEEQLTKLQYEIREHNLYDTTVQFDIEI